MYKITMGKKYILNTIQPENISINKTQVYIDNMVESQCKESFSRIKIKSW